MKDAGMIIAQGIEKKKIATARLSASRFFVETKTDSVLAMTYSPSGVYRQYHRR